jgi:hypothetical protein
MSKHWITYDIWIRWLWMNGIQRMFQHQRNVCWNSSTEFLAGVSNALVLWRLSVGEFNWMKYRMLFNMMHYCNVKGSLLQIHRQIINYKSPYRSEGGIGMSIREILGKMEQLLCAGSVRFQINGPFLTFDCFSFLPA